MAAQHLKEPQTKQLSVVQVKNMLLDLKPFLLQKVLVNNDSRSCVWFQPTLAPIQTRCIPSFWKKSNIKPKVTFPLEVVVKVMFPTSSVHSTIVMPLVSLQKLNSVNLLAIFPKQSSQNQTLRISDSKPTKVPSPCVDPGEDSNIPIHNTKLDLELLQKCPTSCKIVLISFSMKAGKPTHFGQHHVLAMSNFPELTNSGQPVPCPKGNNRKNGPFN
jgi:hypothetical protein